MRAPARRRRLKIGIVALFKNEAMAMREWLSHYKWQGIDRILLMDNNSTDDWRPALKGFESMVDTVSAAKDYAQNEHYNTLGREWIEKHKIDVVGIMDLDEFAFGLHGRNLRSHLEQLFSGEGGVPRPSQLLMKFNMFGSSGLDKQPASIRRGFTWRKRDTMANNTKAFIWTDDLIEFGIHQSDVSGETLIAPPGIQLNHYNIQSREFFRKVKMTRGSATRKTWNKARNWRFFKRYDINEYEDTVLRDMLTRRRGRC
jgi:hypothetical protein